MPSMLRPIFTDVISYHVTDDKILVRCRCVALPICKEVNIDRWLVIRLLLNDCVLCLNISISKYATYQTAFNGGKKDLGC